MSPKIWVHAEIFDGTVSEVSLELLTKARELAPVLGGAAIEATLLGSAIESEAARLAGYGASRVYAADASELEMYSPRPYALALSYLAALHKPDIYLFGATSTGSSLGPAVAARLKTGMAAHCVDLRINGDKKLAALVPSFGGRVIGEILCPGSSPQMASVKPGIFKASEAAAGRVTVERVPPEAWADANPKGSLKPLAIVKHPPRGMPIAEAQVIVCAGSGIGGEENWRLIERLAESLGGAAACTRPVLDEGWCEEGRMIGTSGRSVRPKLYIGFGVSGATHHVCGMNEAGVIINVNRDEATPIFEVSDISVEADVNAILPRLYEALRR
ncbi:MAG: electron transfer flavoprotein subunit alpha/FixB family protein [Synergistaceae bacterium]|jgi:electron transfer flavoprotein alpha subunit|nr:electron transfer flavoprotein subunit alpha/FixB family protein [Synergistaceae bacterium]